MQKKSIFSSSYKVVTTQNVKRKDYRYVVTVFGVRKTKISITYAYN